MGKNKQTVKLVSFDTSTSDSGYAVYENGILKKHGSIAFPPSQNRRQKMTMALKKILEKENPSIVAIELTCVPRNTGTQRKLDRLLGAVECWAWEHDTFFCEYPPAHWRSLVRGADKVPSGRTNKKAWALQRVKDIFGIDLKNDNIADAILIGLAYIKEYS